MYQCHCLCDTDSNVEIQYQTALEEALYVMCLPCTEHVS